MLHAMVVLCMLPGCLSLTSVTEHQNVSSSNYSKVALDIHDCFTRTADVDWRYSEEESWRVTRFHNYTNGKCDESDWRLFECYLPLYELYYEHVRPSERADELTLRYNANGTTNDLDEALELHQQGLDAQERLILAIEAVTEIYVARNEAGVLGDNCSTVFFDLEKLKNETERNRHILHLNRIVLQTDLQEKLDNASIQHHQDAVPKIFSKEALDIFECFKRTVDMNWTYSSQESWRVSRFMNYTNGKCAERYWRVFECYYPLLELYYEAERSINFGNLFIYRYNAINVIKDLEKALELHKLGNDVEKRLVSTIEEVIGVATTRNEGRVFSDNCSKQFLGLENLKNETNQNTLKLYHQHLYLQFLVHQNMDTVSAQENRYNFSYHHLYINVSQNSNTNSTMRYNFSHEDILKCATQRMDMDWTPSEEEMWRVSHFLNYTNLKCAERHWRVFECYYPLLYIFYEGMYLSDLGGRYVKKHIADRKLFDLEKGVELQQKGLAVREYLNHEIEDIINITIARNEPRVLSDSCSSFFFDVADSKFKIRKLKPGLDYNQSHLHWFKILVYYLPPIYLVIFTFGIIGNGVLLYIFWKHPDVRKGPNRMLINLAISDTLLLVIQILFDGFFRYWGSPFGYAACYIYSFAKTSTLAGSVYSMTALSIIRFTALGTGPNDKYRKLLTSTPVIIAIVWILATLSAIPDTIYAAPTCLIQITRVNSLCDFFLISFLPLSIIAGFSLAASRRLRQSARNMPGETIGHTKAKTARERGAKILPVLAVLFAVTYLPLHLYRLMTHFLELNLMVTPHAIRLHHVVSVLINVNSSLNPVALYLASSAFRKLFNKYLFIEKIIKCRRKS